MRSGNGRHRRPRQVPAIVVTAGVTGSALAMPLLAATGASAAEAGTWDKVAECESGGTWSANTGNGSYGGLAFTQEQWKNAGGLEFAERPDLASRSQQIAVAERVLAASGAQAWAQCAAAAGLTQDGPAADVDPGSAGSPRAVGPSPARPDDRVPVADGHRPTDYGAPTPAPATPPPGPLAPSVGLPVMPDPDGATPSPTLPPVFPGDPTVTPSPVNPTDPAVPTPTPTAPGTPAPGDTAGTPAAPGTPSGSPASTAPGSAAPSAPSASPAPGASTDPADVSAATAAATGKHRGAPAAEEPAPSYTVKEGDSLAAIADANGVKGGWSALYQANEQVIGSDADLIKPGQNLEIG
ncbi:transglycosylase family protein [Streptomyces globosus]|uniref:transglycosylase family protein n=1 Tax=Streptomyces globosus TaxID=68209 RepID=UPI00363181EB